MDKTTIKTFAINSRKKLIDDTEYKMSLVGITKDNINEPIVQHRISKHIILVLPQTAFMTMTLKKENSWLRKLNKRALKMLLKKLHILGLTAYCYSFYGNK